MAMLIFYLKSKLKNQEIWDRSYLQKELLKKYGGGEGVVIKHRGIGLIKQL